MLTEERDGDKPLVLYKTAEGNHAWGKYNQRQIDVIMEEILPGQDFENGQESVGIISPYRMQRHEIIEAIGSRNIQVDTVYRYQGQKKTLSLSPDCQLSE